MTYDRSNISDYSGGTDFSIVEAFQDDTMSAGPEADPTGRPANTPGAKLDFGKAPIFRGLIDYFPQAISAVAEVSQKGAEKYTWKGWETVPGGFERYSDALMRHLCAESLEEIDEDTGCLHAAQVAWNALARLQLLINAKGEENASIPTQKSS